VILEGSFNDKIILILFPSGFNTPPLWGVNTGGVGDLFPHKRNAFKVKSSIPRGSAAGIFYFGDNLIVSDGYNTIKFASNGTEAWRKATGGTLYVDSQNNVFIVNSSGTTKYNPAGTMLWTKPYTGKLAFDSANNVAVYSGDTVRHLSSGGTWNWTQIVGDVDTTITPVNGWYNSSIESGEVEYWKFSVVNGNTYSVSWNDYYYGDGTKTGSVYVTAYWEDDEVEIVSRTANGWSSPKTFTATKSGTVILKVERNYLSGTYAITLTGWYNIVVPLKIT
jgi:hypothetical protein